MKASIPVFILVFVLDNSCIISKDDHILKTTTKEWGKSPIALYAWARLSTLMRIIKDGLGGHLKLSVGF